MPESRGGQPFDPVRFLHVGTFICLPVTLTPAAHTSPLASRHLHPHPQTSMAANMLLSAKAAPCQRVSVSSKTVRSARFVSNGTERKVAMFQIWKPVGNKCVRRACAGAVV